MAEFFRPPFCIWVLKRLNDLNSSSFIRFDWILHESAELLSYFQNFLKFKRRDLISWREPTLLNRWIIWFPLLYFSFKKLNDLSSSSFVRFDWIQQYFFHILKISPNWRRGDLISRGNQFCRTADSFSTPFCISVLESWTT